MTDAVPAESTLTPFDGHTVLNTTVAIRNAGDGLSSAMQVAPQELSLGEVVFVVLECEVEKIRFDPIKDTDCIQRVHMLKAGTAVMVDEDLVRAHLDDMELRIEAHNGVTRLPFDDDEEDVSEEAEAAAKAQEDAEAAGDGAPLAAVPDVSDEEWEGGGDVT